MRPKGILLPLGVGLPLFLVGVGGGKEGKERGGRKGGAAPLLVQFGLEGEGRTAALAAPPLLPLRPIRPNILPEGVPVTPRYSGICPKLPKTISVPKHSRPIYRSLRLDHLQTPRHVRDHIRNSELPSVHQNTKTHNTNRHQTLSVRTLRVRELCRHDRDTSPVNNQ